MERPKELKCKDCNEMIYGFSKKDVAYKLLVHSLKHRNQEKEQLKEKSA